MYAQLGFCQGNSGDPIFTETFGVGSQNTSLPAGTTTYAYANNQNPDDGFYTVSSTSNYFDWFNVNDHTPNDSNGRMLIVNSSFTAGEFYKTTINGLCENTTYEFSSWLINLTPPNGFCGAGAIPINVSFEIWDNTDSTLLASGTTGDIFGTTATAWNQYALVFQSTVGQTSVILKMINNAPGGCGNDLAIDDIVFKSCGDAIEVNDGANNNSITLCSTQTPYSETITATPDNIVFSNHFYQWQTSTDGINWTDISGETNASISINGIISTIFYRAKVAEYAANLTNSDCITFSDVFEIIVNQAPAPPTIECWETVIFDDLSCSWTVSGTQPTQPNTECWETASFNNVTCLWEITGTQPQQPTLQCWESTSFNDTSCEWEVTGSQPTPPITECWQFATFSDALCTWEITGSQPTEPTNVECWETATFNNTSCAWEVTGSQPTEPINLECWQTAVFNEDLCEWQIIGSQPIEYRDEFFFLCEDDFLDLEATSTIINPNYEWDSGEISSSITIDAAGIFEVEVTDGCFTEIITFNVTLVETPIIESIVSDGSSIIINLYEAGEYLYSLDGIDYQFSNVFSYAPSGLYTIYTKSNACEVVVTSQHFHFFIQKFITPNEDGKNDFFVLNIEQFFTSTEVYIYNRYGKLLFSAINRNVGWNGTFNGKKLPTSDYWYRIVLDGNEFVGHFTLKY